VPTGKTTPVNLADFVVGTAATITPTLGTTARSLSALFGDSYNLKSLGAALSGLSGDGSAIQAAYSSVPLNGTIDVPIGNWPSGFSITPNTAGAKFWNLLGTLDYGTSAAGTNSVTYIGDGDVAFGFSGGCLQYYQQFTSNLNIRPTVWYNFSFNAASASSGPLYQTASPHIISSMTGVNAGYGVTSYFAYHQSFGQKGNTGYDIGFSSELFLNGTNWGWGAVHLVADGSGTPANSAGAPVIYGMELDIYANGNDVTGSGYNTALGNRQGILIHALPNLGFAARPNSGQVYSAPTTVGTVSTPQTVIIQSVAGVPSIFKCTTSGITAVTAPTFTAGTVTDGTAVWTYQGPSAAQFAHAISLVTDPNAAFGTLLAAGAGGCSVYNAGIDFSSVNFEGTSSAGMRLPANCGVDWSAAGTLASQNLRQSIYNPTSGNFEYQKSQSAVWGLSDVGSMNLYAPKIYRNTQLISASATISTLSERVIIETGSALTITVPIPASQPSGTSSQDIEVAFLYANSAVTWSGNFVNALPTTMVQGAVVRLRFIPGVNQWLKLVAA
jgi:hypothetical protein